MTHYKGPSLRNFRTVQVFDPRAKWSRLYDMEHQVIWINIAAEAEPNVVKFEPKTW